MSVRQVQVFLPWGFSRSRFLGPGQILGAFILATEVKRNPTEWGAGLLLQPPSARLLRDRRNWEQIALPAAGRLCNNTRLA